MSIRQAKLTRTLAPLCTAVLLLTACCRIPELTDNQATIIQEQGVALLQQLELGAVEREAWPAAISALNPEALRIEEDGLYIVIGILFVEEWGFFVTRDGVDFVPTVGGDPSYSRISGRLFEYRVAG